MNFEYISAYYEVYLSACRDGEWRALFVYIGVMKLTGSYA